MEEQVGLLWHHVRTRLAGETPPETGVTLREMHKTMGLFFRALGGDPRVELTPATERKHGARRSWRERLAGSGARVALSSMSAEGLALPERLAVFPSRELNRTLYLWLAAVHALDAAPDLPGPWLLRCQELTRRVCAAFPGLAADYARLVSAHLTQRPTGLNGAEGAREAALCQALRHPGSVTALPSARGEHAPIPLWPAPWAEATPPRPFVPSGAAPPPAEANPGAVKELALRRRGEWVAMPRQEGGVLPARFESILSWADFVPVDRPTDDEDDDSDPTALAADLERLSVARDATPTAARLRFDLDLPGLAVDDLPLSGGELLPEWDWKRGILRPEWCRVIPMLPREAPPRSLPAHLQRPARRLRGEFEAFRPQRHWQRRQSDGHEPDMEGWIEYQSRRREGHYESDPALYRRFAPGLRDLSCLLLADLSLSTAAYVGSERQVIEVIRETLLLFAEALSAAGDRLALCGFSSLKRDQVRFHPLKGFAEPYDDGVRGRILAVKPGYYTRMGAALRQATRMLQRETTSRRLLLLLTDGKPHDIDGYDGRYGIEDTRMALQEARRAGITPFCVTIDDEAGVYGDHLFGPGGHGVIRRTEELSARLPQLYARLTGA